MDNQHRKITGYRELGKEEIALMNEIKALGPQIEEVLLKVQRHLNGQRGRVRVTGDKEELQRLANATPERFLEEGKMSLQVGLMLVTRAVAQPEFF